MKIEILKFGGNCLKDSDTRNSVFEIIKEKIKNKILPVVVVSAIGRKGNPYATDSLLEMIAEVTGTPDIAGIDEKDSDIDLLLSTGETISASIISLGLKKNGIPAKALSVWDSGIITDDKPQSGSVKFVNTSKIDELLDKSIIPVIPGFQGVSDRGNIVTLGRGGSDTTATVLAVALNVEYLEIYTDVFGVMTADPRIVKTAALLDELDFKDAFEFAVHGAKVIHPRAVEIARNYNIPVNIKSIKEPDKSTKIHKIEYDKPITGIAVKEGIAHFVLKTDTIDHLQDNLRIFKLLADNDISVDFISVTDLTISFVIDQNKKNEACEILNSATIDYVISNDVSIISIIGAGMTGIPGIMARIVNSLQKENIYIFQTTDSHTSISCLLKRVDSNKAVYILHTEFNL